MTILNGMEISMFQKIAIRILLVLIVVASVLIQLTGKQEGDSEQPGVLILNYGFPVLFLSTSGAFPYDFDIDGVLVPAELQDFSKAALSARLFACPRPWYPNSEPPYGVRRKGIFLWEHDDFFPYVYCRLYIPDSPSKSKAPVDSKGNIKNPYFVVSTLYLKKMDILVKCFQLAEAKTPVVISYEEAGESHTFQDVYPLPVRSMIFDLFWIVIIGASCSYFWRHQSQFHFFSIFFLIVSLLYVSFHVMVSIEIIESDPYYILSLAYDHAWLYSILYALNMLGAFLCLFCFCQIISPAFRRLLQKIKKDASPETENAP